AVGAHLHGEVRRGSGKRLPEAKAAAVVRRSSSGACPSVLDEAPATCDLHEPLRPNGGHNCERLLHGAGLSGGFEGGNSDWKSLRRREAICPRREPPAGGAGGDRESVHPGG